MTKISDLALHQMEAWSSARSVLALMGEFSSGKSTLANFLLGRDVLPENVTATALPSVWMTYSDTEFAQGLRHTGELEDVELNALGPSAREDFLLLRLGLSTDLLRRTDLVDTPGLSDPSLAQDATLFLAPYLDAVLWCSPVIQAWRKTEVTAWSKFPEKLHDSSVLVLTRADKTRNAADLKKVVGRVTRETEHLFGTVLPLDTPSAAALASGGADLEQSERWVTCGGKGLMAAIDSACIVEKQTDTVVAQVPPADAKPEGENEPQEAGLPVDVLAAPVSVLSMYRTARAEMDLKTHAQASSFFRQFVNKTVNNNDINPAHHHVLERCLSVGDREDLDVERLLRQVELEITDFDTDCWCTLAAVDEAREP